MESSQSLAIESFSHSWLAGTHQSSYAIEEPSRDSLSISHEATSKESVHKVLNSKGSSEESQNFNFDVPTSRFSDVLADADQLFSDGLIRPVFMHQSRTVPSSSPDAVPAIPLSSFSSRRVVLVPTIDTQCNVFRRWRKLSKRAVRKCFRNLRPLCIGGSIKSVRVDDIDRRAWEAKSSGNSPETISPGQSPPSYSTVFWPDTEYESSIYEAVLHCKRSIDK